MSVCGRNDGCVHSGVYNDFVFWCHSWRKLFSFQTFRRRAFFYFFFSFFHFPSQYRFSYLKIITWTTCQTSPKRPAARTLLHFQAFCVHKVTFSHHLAPSFSTPISYTYWLCMCTIQIQTSRKKVQIWHTIDSPLVEEVFKILPKYMHLLMWNMLTYMYRTTFQHPAGAHNPQLSRQTELQRCELPVQKMQDKKVWFCLKAWGYFGYRADKSFVQ